MQEIDKTIVVVVSDDAKFVSRIVSLCNSQRDLKVRHIQAIHALRQTMGSTELRIAIVDYDYTNKGLSDANQAIAEIKGSYPRAYVLMMADSSVKNSAHLLLFKKADNPKVLKAVRYYLDMPKA